MRVLIVFLILLFTSCRQIEDFDHDDLFDPPASVKVNDLKVLKYVYIENWSWYNKVNGDTTIIYLTQLDRDPIFSRIIDLNNWRIKDSVGIKKFVESKGGVLVSPIFSDSSATRFFVQGKASRQFSRCSFVSNHLQIEFHYPTSNGVARQ